ncbi:MAG: hypothetical protein J2P30_00510, partial [Actinobacteria bacterium]|nr:hypothetical protein [Actinomycetota bacterium]
VSVSVTAAALTQREVISGTAVSVSITSGGMTVTFLVIMAGGIANRLAAAGIITPLIPAGIASRLEAGEVTSETVVAGIRGQAEAGEVT